MREMRLTMLGLVGLAAALAFALAGVEAGVEEVVAPVPAAADVGGTGSDSPSMADRFMPARARVT